MRLSPVARYRCFLAGLGRVDLSSPLLSFEILQDTGLESSETCDDLFDGLTFSTRMAVIAEEGGWDAWDRRFFPWALSLRVDYCSRYTRSHLPYCGCVSCSTGPLSLLLYKLFLISNQVYVRGLAPYDGKERLPHAGMKAIPPTL